MTSRSIRVFSAAALSAAALTLAVPAVAHADGTKDPRFGGPPTTSAPERTQHCNDSTESGHDGVTRTRHTLGRTGPTSFVLDYETENVPDKIDVIYQARRSTPPAMSVTTSTRAPEVCG